METHNMRVHTIFRFVVIIKELVELMSKLEINVFSAGSVDK